MKQNYQRLLDQTILQLQEQGRVPRLLLHACCAPCSSYVLEYLSAYFLITVFYYNPNIYPDEEYNKRVAEQKAFIERFPAKHPISFVEGDFDKERFYEVTKGRRSRRVESGASSVFIFGWKRRRNWQKQCGWTILRRHFPSVP